MPAQAHTDDLITFGFECEKAANAAAFFALRADGPIADTDLFALLCAADRTFTLRHGDGMFDGRLPTHDLQPDLLDAAHWNEVKADPAWSVFFEAAGEGGWTLKAHVRHGAGSLDELSHADEEVLHTVWEAHKSAGRRNEPAPLAIIHQPVMATGYVAVCRQGGLWAVGRTPDETIAAAKIAIAEGARCVMGADRLIRSRIADPVASILSQAPAEDEVVVFLCTERVIAYMKEDGDGCVAWRAVGPILDLCDSPTLTQMEVRTYPVNPWTGG